MQLNTTLALRTAPGARVALAVQPSSIRNNLYVELGYLAHMHDELTTATCALDNRTRSLASSILLPLPPIMMLSDLALVFFFFFVWFNVFYTILHSVQGYNHSRASTKMYPTQEQNKLKRV